MTGVVSALPYIVGAVSIILWSRHSDRHVERTHHTAIPILVAALGIGMSTLFGSPALKMVSLSVAGFGIFAGLPVFWTLPTVFLSGSAAAAGIAMINSIGNLAGFVGPFAMGWIKDASGSYTGGLLFLSAVCVIAAVVVILLGHDATLERIPPELEAEP
jgi:nitrate/nitrite transporter NarK